MRIFHTRKITIFSAMRIPRSALLRRAPACTASVRENAQRIREPSLLSFSYGHPNFPRLIA